MDDEHELPLSFSTIGYININLSEDSLYFIVK